MIDRCIGRICASARISGSNVIMYNIYTDTSDLLGILPVTATQTNRL